MAATSGLRDARSWLHEVFTFDSTTELSPSGVHYCPDAPASVMPHTSQCCDSFSESASGKQHAPEQIYPGVQRIRHGDWVLGSRCGCLRYICSAGPQRYIRREGRRLLQLLRTSVAAIRCYEEQATVWIQEGRTAVQQLPHDGDISLAAQPAGRSCVQCLWPLL